MNRKRGLVLLLLGALLATSVLSCAGTPSPTPAAGKPTTAAPALPAASATSKPATASPTASATSKPAATATTAAKPAPKVPADWPKVFRIGTASATTQILGVTMNDLISKTLGVQTTVTPTGSTEEGTTRLANNEFDMFTGMAGSLLVPGLTGADPFAGLPKDQYRWMSNAWDGFDLFVVKANSGIMGFKDLKGKRATLMGPKDVITRGAYYSVLGLYGITDKDVTETPMKASQDNLTDLIEGRTDAALITGGQPLAQLVAAMGTTQLRILPMTPQEQAAAAPYFASTLPAGLYPGQDQPIPMISSGANPILVRKDVPDDVVYTICQVLYDHMTDVQAAFAGFKGMTPAFASDSTRLTVPAHPGAIKYYTDTKLWTDKDVQKANTILASLQAMLSK